MKQKKGSPQPTLDYRGRHYHRRITHLEMAIAMNGEENRERSEK